VLSIVNQWLHMVADTCV